MMMGLVVGLIVEGVMACAILHGLASIVENLTVIRRRLEA
jgi:hypothetical protein